jgi:hypothetical protein
VWARPPRGPPESGRQPSQRHPHERIVQPVPRKVRRAGLQGPGQEGAHGVPPLRRDHRHRRNVTRGVGEAQERRARPDACTDAHRTAPGFIQAGRPGRRAISAACTPGCQTVPTPCAQGAGTDARRRLARRDAGPGRGETGAHLEAAPGRTQAIARAQSRHANAKIISDGNRRTAQVDAGLGPQVHSSSSQGACTRIGRAEASGHTRGDAGRESRWPQAD